MKSQPIKNQHWLDKVDHWSTPIMANLLWVFLSLLVVTMPLGALGLLGVMFRWMDGYDPQVFSAFFGTIRRRWLRIYALAGIDLAVGGLVFLNFLIFQLMDMTDILTFLSRSVTLFVAIFLLLANVYALVLISVWDAPLKQIFRFSMQLVFAQPLWTIAIAFCMVSAVLFSMILPGAILVTCTGAVVAYIACRGTWFVVRKYIPRQQFTLIDIG